VSLAQDLGIAAGCALIALWLYRRAMGGFFTVDDFIYLERAAGIWPATGSAWRFLSGKVYPWLALHAFGRDPVPYLTAQWLFHGMTAALLYLWARRRTTPLVAALAAGLWAGSRQFLTVVYQMTTVSETAALALTLVALWLAERGRRIDIVLATVVFFLALACKESVALLPLLLVLPDGSPTPLRTRIVRAAPLLVVGATWIGYLGITESRAHVFSGSAYASGIGLHVLSNLARYAAWSLDLVHPTPDLGAAYSPFPAALLAGMAIGSIVLARRDRPLALVGMAGWFLAIAPVLPLINARYQHYLYAPLAFLAVAVAGLATSFTLPALSRSRWAWAAVAVVVMAHAAWSDRLVAVRHAGRLPGLGLPFDPFLRKTEFASRFTTGLRDLPRTPSRLLVLEPGSTSLVYNVRTGQAVSGTESKLVYRVVDAVLEGGRAVRFLFPQVDTVAFADEWSPQHETWVVVTHAMDGTSTVHGQGVEAHASVATDWMKAGLGAQAAAHLARVLQAHPDAVRLRYLLAASLSMQGRDADARVELERIVREAREPEATMARAGLRELESSRASAPGSLRR
jgi:hypothetical protein